jgi:N-carbamoylputrescine amidase
METMVAYAGQADMVLFGESFLQGFYSANFDPAHDAQIALPSDDPAIIEICACAAQHGIGVSFGFIERDGERFYSSQITIDAHGRVVDLYRRVSPGWKLPHAGHVYREGEGFHSFRWLGYTIVVGLCGDLWYDEHIEAVNRLAPDVVFWPVYTDYAPDAWNERVKSEYAAQAGKLQASVLYVNSCCLDKTGPEIARGGAAVFHAGAICQEIPSGTEACLLVTL